MYVRMYVCMHVCMYVCMYVRVHVWIGVHTHVHTHICSYPCLHISICINVRIMDCYSLYTLLQASMIIAKLTFCYNEQMESDSLHQYLEWYASQLSGQVIDNVLVCIFIYRIAGKFDGGKF